MARTFLGNNGKLYSIIEPALGKGGEGTVYRISGNPNLVLKIYSDSKRTETRKRKLLAMISTPLSSEAMKQVTWPVDIVYENGQFVGYVMPAISNNEDLNVMYSDKYICTFTEKITIARNLCAAINAVHNTGQVCGDLNPKNIGVDPQNAKVTLVDTDSYHISDKNSNRVYRCEVGMPEYLPREIQEKMKNGYRLDNAPLPTFTKQTDLFALAVHIFALLMNGCHPFACATSTGVNIGSLSISQPSVAAPQPIDNICTGFFPFYQKRNGISTPLYAPEFDMLPKQMKELFIRAFVDGHSDPTRRPDAVEWYNALVNLEKDVSICKRDKKHIYPSHLNKCPWCELESKMKQSIPTPVSTTVHKQNIQQTQINIQSSRNVTQSYSGKKTDGIFASETMFWTLTILVPLAIQLAIHYLSGNMIVYEIFGSSYGSGIEYWGTNFAIWLGPWGFIICGLIGTCLYNTYWCKNGKAYGYKWYHYTLSVIVSFIGSALWILFVLILSFAIVLFVGAIIIAAICGALSGS